MLLAMKPPLYCRHVLGSVFFSVSFQAFFGVIPCYILRANVTTFETYPSRSHNEQESPMTSQCSEPKLLGISCLRWLHTDLGWSLASYTEIDCRLGSLFSDQIQALVIFGPSFPWLHHRSSSKAHGKCQDMPGNAERSRSRMWGPQDS